MIRKFGQETQEDAGPNIPQITEISAELARDVNFWKYRAELSYGYFLGQEGRYVVYYDQELVFTSTSEGDDGLAEVHAWQKSFPHAKKRLFIHQILDEDYLLTGPIRIKEEDEDKPGVTR
jgi:hypothetical protein